jgi:hypothetical protein
MFISICELEKSYLPIRNDLNMCSSLSVCTLRLHSQTTSKNVLNRAGVAETGYKSKIENSYSTLSPPPNNNHMSFAAGGKAKRKCKFDLLLRAHFWRKCLTHHMSRAHTDFDMVKTNC